LSTVEAAAKRGIPPSSLDNRIKAMKSTNADSSLVEALEIEWVAAFWIY